MEFMEALPTARCKRRRMSDELQSEDSPSSKLSVLSRQFFTIHKGSGVFDTEEWRSADKTLFRPVSEDMMVGVAKVEQITCQDGSFFVADLSGRYSRTAPGKVIHLWRYDKVQRKLYVSRSFLFTNTAEFVSVQQFLQRL
ncbi:uncharacterized protein LOC112573939 isoform X2 [Pomacea canaliculata]|nr:uncharacterized protein LOC112573939 isoform X2 [Pomacea canaliculata]XP_025110431.1 uncharacterized protein LOC112573939 isoform X2 [Pomacea canaliculata]XP_025110432.1 uncharacterized protein LOC112573939 isoform X2 [Pomacea canaliculata]